jgi:DNA-binding transcriptional LysR family regulator
MDWLPQWDSFVKVVEEGSMAGAARRLDCTRAQVSRQIGELEQAFGVRLFERSTRRLALTPSGEVFHRHAVNALAAIEGAEVAVRNAVDAPRGLLRVSATINFGRECVAPIIPDVLARYPELDVELVLSDSQVNMAERGIDLALRLLYGPTEDVVSRQLLVLQRIVCAAPAYLAAHGRPQVPADLADHQCFSFVLADDKVWRLTDSKGEEHCVPVNGRYQSNNIGCILDAVRAGHGLAVLPAYMCGADLATGRLVRVLDYYVPQVNYGSKLYACYLPSRARVPKVQVFLAALEAAFTPSPPWERYRTAE